MKLHILMRLSCLVCMKQEMIYEVSSCGSSQASLADHINIICHFFVTSRSISLRKLDLVFFSLSSLKLLWEIISFYGWRDKTGQINQYKANESKLNLLKQNYWEKNHPNATQPRESWPWAQLMTEVVKRCWIIKLAGACVHADKIPTPDQHKQAPHLNGPLK